MKTKLVRIGNSRGVRLPKPLIEEAGLRDDLVLKVEGNSIIIAPVSAVRSDWAEAAKLLSERQGDRLLDPPTGTRFDERDWNW